MILLMKTNFLNDPGHKINLLRFRIMYFLGEYGKCTRVKDFRVAFADYKSVR